METYQFISIIGANILIFLGFMGSVIAMILYANKRIDAVQNEMKDFHARLLLIEERKIKIHTGE